VTKKKFRYTSKRGFLSGKFLEALDVLKRESEMYSS